MIGRHMYEAYVLAAAAALAALASLGTADAGVTTLYAFKGTDGEGPNGLIADSAGNLYGTTYGGGGSTGGCEGCGTVFTLSPDGRKTVLHAFADQNGDGAFPEGDLVEDEEGNLYGTTNQGPASRYNRGEGIVFRLAPDGTETILYTFTGKDGADPAAGLIRDEAGNLYGTTEYGGSAGDGTLFRLKPDGSETVLYSFRGHKDGAYPKAGLIRDRRGNLYGTTMAGGGEGDRALCYGHCGTVFRLAPDGSETVLHAFSGGSDGANPVAGVIEDKSGDLYGTTYDGGGDGCYYGKHRGLGCGTVFKLAPDGTETVLYAFSGGRDGANPFAGVIEDKSGNLYGTTASGGGTGCAEGYNAPGCGTVFRLAPDGKETVLYAFRRARDGASPQAGLLKAGKAIFMERRIRAAIFTAPTPLSAAAPCSGSGSELAADGEGAGRTNLRGQRRPVVLVRGEPPKAGKALASSGEAERPVPFRVLRS